MLKGASPIGRNSIREAFSLTQLRRGSRGGGCHPAIGNHAPTSGKAVDT